MAEKIISPAFPDATDLQEALGSGDNDAALAASRSLLNDPLAKAGLGGGGGSSEFKARGMVESEQGKTGTSGQ